MPGLFVIPHFVIAKPMNQDIVEGGCSWEEGLEMELEHLRVGKRHEREDLIDSRILTNLNNEKGI